MIDKNSLFFAEVWQTVGKSQLRKDDGKGRISGKTCFGKLKERDLILKNSQSSHPFSGNLVIKAV